MNTAIAELLDYFDGGQPSVALENVLETLERVNVRLILMQLCDWLKRQQRFGNEKPLELRQDHVWCKDLAIMLEHWPAMNELFVIEARHLKFREGVSADQREQLRHIAVERYQPVLRT
jgi:hypothetical protein